MTAPTTETKKSGIGGTLGLIILGIVVGGFLMFGVQSCVNNNRATPTALEAAPATPVAPEPPAEPPAAVAPASLVPGQAAPTHVLPRSVGRLCAHINLEAVAMTPPEEAYARAAAQQAACAPGVTLPILDDDHFIELPGGRRVRFRAADINQPRPSND